MKHRFLSGFTLIELLIVVAIIAILAAIAVPNFLEAQVRSKVSRCKTDMRTCATAFEAFKVDTNHYPPDTLSYTALGFDPWKTIGQQRADAGLPRAPQPLFGMLTSPVAYLTSPPADIFNVPVGKGPQPYDFVSEGQITFDTTNPFYPPTHPARKYGTSYGWALSSLGPDRLYSGGRSYIYGLQGMSEQEVSQSNGAKYSPPRFASLYDATNGSVSWGDIVRVGP